MDLQVIPDSWAATNLGSIVDYGKTQKCELADIDDVTWVVELEDIEKDTSRIISRGYTPARDFKSSKNIFNKGDILYGKLRPYLNKVVMADENGVCSTEIIPINAEPLVINKYIFYWVKSHRFLDYVNDVSYGVNMPRLGTSDGLNAPFILAPFAEQKEIVDRLDILLAQVEATQARLARIPDIIKQFRQSVLSAALSGKLTEKWRNINNVKIQEWSSKALADIASVIDPNPSHRYPEPEAQGVPILSTQQFIGDSGWTKEKSKLVSKSFHSERMGKCGFFEGDIVFARKGRLGLARFSPSGFDYVYSHTLFIVRAKKEVYPKFLLWSLRPNSVVEHLLTEMNSNTGVPTLGKSVFERMKICLPSYIEQTEIVHRVEQLFAYADTIEQQAKAAKERVDNLTQAILAKAFRGELTADWRAANPDLISGNNSAAALLARIQAERATAKPRKRASKPAISPTSSGVPQ